MLFTKNWPISVDCRAFLRERFLDESDVELLGFPELHSAYFNISGQSFMKVLSLTPRSMVDQRDAMGRTALFWASGYGDHLAVARLLTCGADPNIADITGANSLHWACRAADVTCMQLLLQAKADVHANTYGVWSLLHMVTQYSCSDGLELLLEHGLDIQSRDRFGRTPLHIAAGCDDADTLLYLLQCGGDINAQNSQGSTPLLTSVLNNSHAVIPHLLEHESLDINAVNNVDIDVIGMAAGFGDLETLDVLYRAINIFPHVGERLKAGGMSSLESAIWRKDFNDTWARSCKKLPDEDPVVWFAAFKRLHDEISIRQQKALENSCDDEGWISDSHSNQRGLNGEPRPDSDVKPEYGSPNENALSSEGSPDFIAGPVGEVDDEAENQSYGQMPQYYSLSVQLERGPT